MNNDLFKAGVSRRGFLTGSAALCVMAGLGLTGCGGSGAESGSAAASGQDVEYRDELQIALPASPDGLDPHTTSSLVTMDIICNVVEPLFGLDSDYEPQPVLAKGYEVSDDGLTYTIKLREGVTFHNGKEFGSEDVVASMNRWLTVNDRAASLLPGATFAASGDHEVTCTLTEPAIDFLIILGNHSQYPGIFPSEVIEAAGYEPEHDLDNPADSVFCAHGAGFVVPWEQVRSHMHVDSGWGKSKSPEQETQAVPQRRTAAYRATLEEDAELLKIFERTYGPIKRDPLAAFRPVQKRERPDFDAQQWEILPEYLLVDGYNIIFAWDELNALAKYSLEAARHKLMDILCNYQGYQKCNLILVFDAYRVPGSPGSIKWNKGTKVESYAKTPSGKFLKEKSEYAYLDDSFWKLLKGAEYRKEIKQLIVKTFLK